MGNLLESDSNGEEGESSRSTALNLEFTEPRTEGDGMESGVLDNSDLMTGPDRVDLDFKAISLGVLPCSPINANLNASSLNNIINKKSSPKYLPSREQLIQLKPIKYSNKDNYAQTVENSIVRSQKEPKFIPYEPYRGAIRLMTEDPTKSHSRKPSNSSSIVALPCVNSLPEIPDPQKFSISMQASSSRSSENSISEPYKMEQSHSTLLKERLKISEKDIESLQAENSRLKKLLVNSLSGAGPLAVAEEMKRATLNIKSQAQDTSIDKLESSHSISESFDNLSDEIEVWRSKFLSSCVLVEQLTKENQRNKEHLVSATELFREVKNSTDLTEQMYTGINKWLQSCQNTCLKYPLQRYSFREDEKCDFQYKNFNYPSPN